MIFHTFKSQEERRGFGGSEFVEIQFCKLAYKTSVREIVEVRSVEHWQDDSLYLYIDDVDKFQEDYNHIFNCGIYNNLKSGIVDIHGINYYKLDFIDMIIANILEDKPEDYEILVDWLGKAKNYNGFYFLGM